MKILITGGRKYKDKGRMYKALNTIARLSDTPIIIVHGNAVGADRMARDWAVENGYEHKSYPIEEWEWDKYGKGAGPKRNHRMLNDNLDIECCLAFPDKESRGTYDMTERTAIEGIPTKIYPKG